MFAFYPFGDGFVELVSGLLIKRFFQFCPIRMSDFVLRFIFQVAPFFLFTDIIYLLVILLGVFQQMRMYNFGRREKPLGYPSKDVSRGYDMVFPVLFRLLVHQIQQCIDVLPSLISLFHLIAKFRRKISWFYLSARIGLCRKSS